MEDIDMRKVCEKELQELSFDRLEVGTVWREDHYSKNLAIDSATFWQLSWWYGAAKYRHKRYGIGIRYEFFGTKKRGRQNYTPQGFVTTVKFKVPESGQVEVHNADTRRDDIQYREWMVREARKYAKQYINKATYKDIDRLSEFERKSIKEDCNNLRMQKERM